ncbi:hypothetical protein A3Q56_01312 [Intoshia linei]|uniref:Uncharacterized protein n=1 Tax=Intoshia linei TaxID=1819745 RepID=A0A177B9G9_9BILA|nr:hypothetical protein A3Q56_01312 [Intoshia linei]
MAIEKKRTNLVEIVSWIGPETEIKTTKLKITPKMLIVAKTDVDIVMSDCSKKFTFVLFEKNKSRFILS